MSDLEDTPRSPEFGSPPAPDRALQPVELADDEPAELFQSWSQPEAVAAARIPHLGHLCLLAALGVLGVVCAAVLIQIALHFHLYGVTTQEQAKGEIHYLLGSQAILYFATLALSIFVFPLFWNKSFFAGIHWRGATALRLRWRLLATALGCFALAGLDSTLLPGPSNAPIDEIFRSPGAAWLMFGFGITLAPLCEEILFRGFLLPSFATAWDWVSERITGKRPLPLDENGHPRWSILAMAAASIITSLLFALMHAEQTGKSIGPFLLLITVSLVLCAVRIKTRSLAASTMVHAFYNFVLFFSMLVGTGGFRHLENM
jgi:membrane protease YdiL (CAAX protease family)